MRDITIAITAASYSGNKGAYAMLQSSIKQLKNIYGERLHINLMSVYPGEDKKQAPFDFINIVSCKPEQLLFVAFPLAILYKLLGWIPFRNKLFKCNKIIKAYLKTDLVIDEAGISFVDSRGFVMNTYAFVCAAVPLLLGVPVVKYSQAMGSFHSRTNRLLAKWILPHLKLICARGEITKKNLAGIGIEDNVRLCADGVFSMPEDTFSIELVNGICAQDSFYNGKIVSLSLSSVVQDRCAKIVIDYVDVMIGFVDFLNEKDYNVLIIANAAREGKTKPRNNDLLVCDAVYEGVRQKDMVRWYPKEMTAEEIREFISHTDVLVGSRFHAMIGALEKRVPTLLIGWSHKYQEVLDMFELGQNAVDFSTLSVDTLKVKFEEFITNKDKTRQNIVKHLNEVKESSQKNILYISEVINGIVSTPCKGALLDVSDTERYLGRHITCRMGYASNEMIRANSASGGVVTAFLCHLLKSKQIDGAWVTKSVIKEGKLGYKTFVATKEEQIMDCSSSIYMHMPLLKNIDEIMQFDGRLAVVLLPCQMRTLNQLMEKRPAMKKKVVLKIALYCSGSHTQEATLVPLTKAKISLDYANRIYYRRGHWRGLTAVKYDDGHEETMSYTETICAYKNAYFFINEACTLCQDQFGKAGDISFGDIWLPEMKRNPIKHTGCIIRNENALGMYESAVKAKVIIDTHIGDEKVVYSQKRALVFKYNCASEKERLYHKNGKKLKLDTLSHCKINHKLAYRLAHFNMELSRKHPKILERVPMKLIFLYMLFIRFLLSF
ncbi:polysaccharide pyruvyl transferase family protein [Desulfosporosinus hippei]|uniref:Coenzyme F420-reducing hydrogenase, beta subunit n=1 Tax=Desulfosporosinus hippei DSM 8344 TaxID=1121419 RepID=A0A1G8HIK4_9FIRM|nr:polysaccharide pyruvyl transferase family protein [Desulfosporosinus hippei]SDI06331.1 Coenzyme F420-reducing hydrogenase, beta subunit [Desulfosporosinus hippei DSM 8344]